MKNIIFLLVFESLVFGVNLEPTKPRTLQDIKKDVLEDIKTVESESDECIVLKGMLTFFDDENKYIQLCDNKLDYKSFYDQGGDFVYPVSATHGLDIVKMVNGGFVFKLEKLENFDFEEINENLKHIDYNLSEKFKKKYLTQSGEYVGENISKAKAFDILSSLANKPCFEDCFKQIEVQNIYSNVFYISDKACLNLIVEKNSDETEEKSNIFKFTNGADFNAQECKEVFDNQQIKELQKELNEKRNRFIVEEYDEIAGTLYNFIDGLNKIRCYYSYNHYTEKTNEALYKIFNNDDKYNQFRLNHKGEYHTGIMIGEEELIVNITENGVIKSFEKPKSSEEYNETLRCQLLEK